ncbi:hypothetical protein [Nocardia asteroides]
MPGASRCPTVASATCPRWDLIPAPNVLIADSPTASPDQGTAYAVWKSLRDYADTGAAVLIITNDLPLVTATGYADHLAIMTRDRIRATGTLPDLAVTEDPLIRRYFQAS